MACKGQHLNAQSEALENALMTTGPVFDRRKCLPPAPVPNLVVQQTFDNNFASRIQNNITNQIDIFRPHLASADHHILLVFEPHENHFGC